MKHEPEILENELQKIEPTALEAQTRGEVDIQVATAKRFPRSIARFRKRALDMATVDPEIASSCYYSLIKGGTTIEGASIRLAEIVAATYGNLRAETRIVDEGEKHVTAQASIWDLENNVAVRVETRRGIVGRSGKRYNPDMINTTCNAAASIALRNAIFRVVPKAYIAPILERCREVGAGDAESLASNRTQALQWLESKGVSRERVFAALGKEGIEDIGIGDVATLRGIVTAVRDGESSFDESFPPLTAENAQEMKPGRHQTRGKTKQKAEPDDNKNTGDIGKLNQGELELLGMVSRAETTDDIELLMKEIDRRKVRKQAAKIIVEALAVRRDELNIQGEKGE